MKIRNALKSLQVIATFILFPAIALGKGLAFQPSFSHLTPDEGLSSATVNDIRIDNKGVVWIATKDGLNRFNGKTVSVYRPNSNEEGPCVGNIINCLEYDGEDIIYLSISDYLSVFNIKKHTFKNIRCKNISKIAYHNCLYVAYDNIIARFKDVEENFEPVYSLKEGLSISALVFQGDKLWIGTKQDGLYLSVAGEEPHKMLDAGKVADVYCDSKGYVWVCTWTKGLFRMEDDGKFINYRNSSSDIETVSSDFVRTCCEDGEGNIWIGTIKGIDRIDNLSGQISRIRSYPESRSSLSNNSIWKLRKDRQGNIWVATYYGGVNYFNPEVELFSCYYPSPYRDKGLSNPIVGRIYDDGNDCLLIATEAGFNHLDRTTGKFTWYGIAPDGNATLEHVKALFHDKAKNMVWVGADMSGLFRVNLKSGDIKAYYNDPDNPFTIPSNRVRDVIPYKNDSLIVATQSGICVFSMITGKCRRILSNYSEVDVVTDITLDADGRLWIVDSEGLYRYDMASGKIHCYSEGNSPGKFVSCTFFDSTGEIWMGTYDSGVFKYNPDTDDFTHFPLAGLSSLCINSMEEIPSTGDIILSTSSGFCILNSQTGATRIYDAENGYPFCSTSENSLFVSGDETVFLGSSQGMVSFKTENLYRSPRRFDIIPERVIVDGKQIQYSEESGTIQMFKGSSLVIELSTTNYILSDHINLEYNLSGKNEWQAIGPSGILELSKLKTGRYILTIKDNEVAEDICPPLQIKIFVVAKLSSLVVIGLLLLLGVISLLLIFRRRKETPDEKEEDNLTPSQLLCKKAREVVETHIDDSHFDISIFCSEMGMSRTVLFQKIKEATDKTPNDFILSIRLEKAAKMLEKNLEFNVSDIAEKTGFSSSAYFSQKFKEVYNMPPLTYRKKTSGK